MMIGGTSNNIQISASTLCHVYVAVQRYSMMYSTIKCGLASFTDGQNNLANFTVVVRAIKLINIIIIKLTLRN